MISGRCHTLHARPTSPCMRYSNRQRQPRQSADIFLSEESCVQHYPGLLSRDLSAAINDKRLPSLIFHALVAQNHFLPAGLTCSLQPFCLAGFSPMDAIMLSCYHAPVTGIAKAFHLTIEISYRKCVLGEKFTDRETRIGRMHCAVNANAHGVCSRYFSTVRRRRTLRDQVHICQTGASKTL